MDCCDPPVVTIQIPTVDVTVGGSSIVDVTVIDPSSSVATVNTETFVTIKDPPPAIVVEIGTVVGPVATSNLDAIYAPILFSSFSPLILANLSAGDIVVDCEVHIGTTFDDPGATIEVGTPAGLGSVMASNENDPQVAATYGTDENYIATVSETFQATISPGISAQGSGYVLATIRRA
jgi:hypothetical protein